MKKGCWAIFDIFWTMQLNISNPSLCVGARSPIILKIGGLYHADDDTLVESICLNLLT